MRNSPERFDSQTTRILSAEGPERAGAEVVPGVAGVAGAKPLAGTTLAELPELAAVAVDGAGEPPPVSPGAGESPVQESPRSIAAGRTT